MDGTHYNVSGSPEISELHCTCIPALVPYWEWVRIDVHRNEEYYGTLYLNG